MNFRVFVVFDDDFVFREGHSDKRSIFGTRGGRAKARCEMVEKKSSGTFVGFAQGGM